MRPIVTITMNPALDIATATEVIVPSAKLRCDEPRYDPGGGGINVARAARMLGVEALAVFPIGGGSGQMVEILVKREGVPHLAVPIEGITRESLAVVERRSGKQYRFLLPGPPLSAADQKRCLDTLASHVVGATFIVASGSLPPSVPHDFYRKIGAIAESCGARFVLDTSGEALTGTDCRIFMIKASLRELEQLRGAVIADDAAQERAAQAVVAEGRCEVLVVSLGGEGALLATRSGCQRFPAVRVSVLSSVGAGDSMLAGFLVALVRGWALAEAVKYGIAAGSAAVLRPGTELCRRDDTDRLFGEIRSHAALAHPL